MVVQNKFDEIVIFKNWSNNVVVDNLKESVYIRIKGKPFTEYVVEFNGKITYFRPEKKKSV